MNRYRSRLRGPDGMVALGCILFSLLTLGAIGESGRRRAKEIVCQSNLRQWHNVFLGYIEENDGVFLSGCNDQGYWWPMQLSHQLQDWKRNRTWFCPTATTPMWNEAGVRTPSPYMTYAWGIEKPSTTGAPSSMTYRGKTYTLNRNGLNGSYGLNGYVIPIPGSERPSGTNTYERGVPATESWRDLFEVPDAGRVPMFLDALRFDVWPLPTDAPAPVESAP